MNARPILRGDSGAGVVLIDGVQAETRPGEAEPPAGALYRLHKPAPGVTFLERLDDPRDGVGADTPATAESPRDA